MFRFSLADTAVKNREKYLINIKERLPSLFSDFIKYRTLLFRDKFASPTVLRLSEQK